MNVKLKFGEAVPHLDLEAETYFILLFNSKDPDELTIVSQGDQDKVSLALLATFKNLQEAGQMPELNTPSKH